MAEENNKDISSMIEEYKRLTEEIQQSYNQRLSMIQDLHSQILNILGLKDWNEQEILKRAENITNDEKIRIHGLWMVADMLSKNLLNEAMENYDSSLNVENAFIEAFAKQNFENLPDEDAKIIQNIYKEIKESQGRQINNYPIFEQIKEYLRKNDINQ